MANRAGILLGIIGIFLFIAGIYIWIKETEEEIASTKDRLFWAAIVTTAFGILLCLVGFFMIWHMPSQTPLTVNSPISAPNLHERKYIYPNLMISPTNCPINVERARVCQ